MIRLALKLLAATAVMAGAVTAAPASAWYAYTYLHPNGTVAGGQIYCDNGYLAYSEGIVTSNYTVEYHYGEPPC